MKLAITGSSKEKMMELWRSDLFSRSLFAWHLRQSIFRASLRRKDLDNFRMEIESPGLSSYPHPRLMPDFWEYPTVSMGLGCINSIYQLVSIATSKTEASLNLLILMFGALWAMEKWTNPKAWGHLHWQEEISWGFNLGGQLQLTASRWSCQRKRQNHSGARRLI